MPPVGDPQLLVINATKYCPLIHGNCQDGKAPYKVEGQCCEGCCKLKHYTHIIVHQDNLFLSYS